MKDRSPLRVGKVNFINTLPIFYPLESGAIPHDFEIIEGSPAHLNALLAAGQIDLGVVSSIEYGRHFERYWLLPDLSISCTTRIHSVLLLSRVALGELAGQEILLTSKSDTSAALLKLLFSHRFGLQVDYRIVEPPLGGDRWPPGATALLVIGDDALRLRGHPEVRLVLDLGAAWHQWTRHSFVFAVWALRREALLRGDGLVRQALATLLAAREYGLSHLEELARKAGRRSWFSEGQCLQYLGNISYDLGRDKQAGLRLFFDKLYESGELSRPVEVNFLPASKP